MAFSNLRSLTQAQYDALNKTPIYPPPDVTSTGSPDSRVTIQLGGWVSQTVMAFTVTNSALSGSGISIDGTNSETLDINVVAGTNPSGDTTYWTVDVGSTDGSNSQWSISFQVDANNRDTGTWTFTKGKTP